MREDEVVVGVPTLNRRVEDGPLRFDVGAWELDPDRLANHAVQPVASDDPLRDNLAAHAVTLERRAHKVLTRRQGDQAGGAGHSTSVCLEIFRKHRLGDLLRNPEPDAVYGHERHESTLRHPPNS